MAPPPTDPPRRRRRRRAAPSRRLSPHSRSYHLPLDCAAFVAVLLIVCGSVLLIVFLTRFTGPDFIYYGDESAYPVVEYLGLTRAAAVAAAPEGALASTGRLTAEGQGEEGEDEGAAYDADFLLNSTKHNRVVEFYAPWCPHCRHYKPRYVELARNVTEMVTKTAEGRKGGGSGGTIKFYAVSCTAHKTLCLEQGIRGFPTIKLFRAGNGTGVEWRRREALTAESVLREFCVGVAAAPAIEQKENIEVEPKVTKRKLKDASRPSGGTNTGDVPRRTKAELYHDASLSFNFALRQSIFMSKGPLPSDARDALRDWLVLLQRTLPPHDDDTGMGAVLSEVDAMLADFDYVARGESNLREVIRDVEHEEDPHGGSEKWSPSCTHGSPYGGYTCGLWELFHIVTVGVARQTAGSNVGGDGGEGEGEGDGEDGIIAPAQAADALKRYVENFFGCNVCRENFVAEYEGCAYDHCRRLADDPTALEAGSEVWRELPIWLWQMHNDVNVRLQRERAERDGRPSPSREDDAAVRWPSRSSCPACWNDDGTAFGKEAVYAFLEAEYWPSEGGGRGSGSGGQRVTGVQMTSGGATSAPLSSYGELALVVLFVIPFVFVFWWLLRRREKELSGRHKKLEEDAAAFRAEGEKKRSGRGHPRRQVGRSNSLPM